MFFDCSMLYCEKHSLDIHSGVKCSFSINVSSNVTLTKSPSLKSATENNNQHKQRISLKKKKGIDEMLQHLGFAEALETKEENFFLGEKRK
ncbi:MAG: hypothetical protein ABSE15_04620 [Candidatus Bathyarchaeia archaeon]|jgi:hypothetical protein